MKYLIIGMPRCRTAWLSTFLSSGSVNIGHETFAEYKCKSFEDYYLITNEYDLQGDSTTMMPFLHQVFEKDTERLCATPGMHVILVVRNVLDCLNASLNLMRTSSLPVTSDVKNNLLNRLRSDREWIEQWTVGYGQTVKLYDHNHLMDRITLRDMYKDVTGRECNEAYLDKMMRLNIQREGGVLAYDTHYIRSLINQN